jgi:hypothetical protein
VLKRDDLQGAGRDAEVAQLVNGRRFGTWTSRESAQTPLKARLTLDNISQILGILYDVEYTQYD